MLTFEEDDPEEPLELAVKEVTSIVKSAGEKVNFQCTLGQEILVSISGRFICQQICTLDLCLSRQVRGCLSKEPVQTPCIDSLLSHLVSRMCSRASPKSTITRVMPSF